MSNETKVPIPTLHDITRKSTPLSSISSASRSKFRRIRFRKFNSSVKFRKEYLVPSRSTLEAFADATKNRGLSVIEEQSWSGRSRFESRVSSTDDTFVDDVVIIERPIYTQKDFDQGFEGGRLPERTICTWVKSKIRKCECSRTCLNKFFMVHLPFLSILRDYSIRQDFIPDIIAGLTVGIMHIPQGMAYGQLSTLPPVFGLYTSFFPVILYFFFGTSRHVSIGTFAVISLMVGSAVDRGLKIHGLEYKTWNVTDSNGTNATDHMVDNSAELLDIKLKLAMSVTFVVGVMQVLLGVFHLGFLTVYLSDSLISSFTTGAACHVFTSQVKHIFGISMGQYSGAFRLVFSYRDVVQNLPETNVITFIASFVCMLLLVIVKEFINSNPRFKRVLIMPIPIDLIVVIIGTVISNYVKLKENYNVKIVGDIPLGIPLPNLNAFTYLPQVITDSIALAVVGFAVSVSMAKIFAKKHDYDVDSNQELLAYGLCNIMSSFFSSFVSAVSLSRSLVQENAGGRTQVTGLVSSVLLLLVLLFVGPYFKALPNCVLASIILIALRGMFKQFSDLKALWSISFIDFTVWLVTFTSTCLLDVDLGLLIGVGFSILTAIIRFQRPYCCLLGQVPGTDIYKDMSVYKTAEEISNIKIFRFDSALFFANSEYFKSSLYKMTVDPKELREKQKQLDKRRKKEEAEMLNVTVDSLGSASLGPSTESENESMRKLPSGDPLQRIKAPSAQAAGVGIHRDGSIFQINQLPTLTHVYFIVLDCSTMSYVDVMGVKVLQQVITELRPFNVMVYLAQCKSSVREMFECTNFYKTGSRNYVFVTVHDAVVSAQLLKWSIIGGDSPKEDNVSAAPNRPSTSKIIV